MATRVTVNQSKGAPYEEAIRVPLLVRGPGVATHATVSALASNIDLAPTLAEWAGATADRFVDGRSLVPLLGGDNPGSWRHALLIERTQHPRPDPSIRSAPVDAPHRRIPPYAVLRTEEIVYVEYATGEQELYDLRRDPYQLNNLASNATPVLLDTFSTHLDQLLDCAAAGCRAAEDASVPSL